MYKDDKKEPRVQEYRCPECGRLWAGWIEADRDDRELICRDCQAKLAQQGKPMDA